MTNGFGPLLAAYRQEHGISQEELADQLGTSQNRISRWEKGTGYPKEPAIRRSICDLLDYPADRMESDRAKDRLRPIVETADTIAALVEANADLTAQMAALREELDQVRARLSTPE